MSLDREKALQLLLGIGGVYFIYSLTGILQ
jgi:hypothetical protein